MAYSAKVGSFNIDTTKLATQTQAITGVGFTPKIVLFWWSGTTRSIDGVAGEDTNFGFGAMSGATSRFALASTSDDANGTSTSANYAHDTACIVSLLNGSAVVDGAADFSSFDADGFTLVIDDQFTSALRVSYLALGGDDLTNVFIGSQVLPTVTGNYGVTGVGFQPDALLFVQTGRTSLPGSYNSATPGLGMATGASNQGVVAGFDRTGQATTAATGYGYNGECSVNLFGAGATTRDSLVSLDADGFTNNHVEGNSAFYYFFIALKGGQYSVGDITTRTDGNDIAETAPGFQPVALLFASANRALSTQDTTTAHLALSIGAATSTTNRAAQAAWSENGLADSETATANYDTACYANVADDAIVALMDIKSIDANGFTAVMDDVETSASWVTYLAIGAAAGGTTRTATPITAALKGTFTRTISTLTAALKYTGTRTAAPITAALSGTFTLTASTITAALKGTFTRTASTVTAALTQTSSRTLTPVTAALTSTLTRTVSPITTALSGTFTRTATSVTAALSGTFTRTASTITAALAFSASRTITPVTAALSGVFTRTASSVTAALAGTFTRTASSVSGALKYTGTRTVGRGAELLSNSGFETAGAGGADVFGSWTEVVSDGAIADETTLVHGDGHAIRITAGVNRNTECYQTVNVAPSHTYPVSFWTRGDGANAGRYFFYDVTNGAYITGVTSTGVAGTSYQRVSTTLQAPSNCTQAALYLQCPNIDGGVAYFDDVSAKERTLTAALRYIGTRSLTPINAALKGSFTRTAAVSAALSGVFTRTATPITVSLVSRLSRTASSITASLKGTLTRTVSSITAALVSTFSRTATPITVSLSMPAVDVLVTLTASRALNVSLSAAATTTVTLSAAHNINVSLTAS